MHWGDYGYGWGMGFGWLFMIVFWVLVILGVVFVIKIVAGTGRRESSAEAPLDILKRRYAKGEITKEEFEEKKKDIQ